MSPNWMFDGSVQLAEPLCILTRDRDTWTHMRIAMADTPGGMFEGCRHWRKAPPVVTLVPAPDARGVPMPVRLAHQFLDGICEPVR